MARLYSFQLGAYTLTGTSSIDLPIIDVPTTVVRDWSGYIISPNDDAGYLQLSVNGLVVEQVSFGPSTQNTFSHEGRVVAPGPQIITVSLVSVGSVAEFIVSGYEFTS